MAKRLSLAEAIRQALSEEMERDERVIVFGEDVGKYGGVFGCTRGLYEKFGKDRVKDTPLSEGGIVGAAVGAAAAGLKPVAEIMFVDLVPVGGAMNQIVNQLAVLPYSGGGQIKLPVVIRMPCGSRYPMAATGPHHAQSLEAWFMHTPGLKVVIPSNPYDAKGLFKTAIRDDSPVIFFEHRMLYSARHKVMEKYVNVLSEVPDEEYTIPFGQAIVVRPGRDVTIVATMMMVHKAIAAATELEKEGISAEIIDPRTLVPFDKQRVLESVKKTKKVVIVSEDRKTAGVASEIAAIVAEEAFSYLDVPVRRVSALDIPVPYTHALEEIFLPQELNIIEAVRSIVKRGG